MVVSGISFKSERLVNFYQINKTEKVYSPQQARSLCGHYCVLSIDNVDKIKYFYEQNYFFEQYYFFLTRSLQTR